MLPARVEEPRHHLGLELLHLGQDLRHRRAAEAGVDRADAQRRERLDVGGDIGRCAGEQLALAVVGLVRQAVALAREAHRDADRLRIAAGLAPSAGAAARRRRSARLRLSSGKAGLLGIGYQASPILAVRRSAGPDSPPTQIGMPPFCAGLGAKVILSNFTYSPEKLGLSFVHSSLEGGDVFVGHLAALVEGRRAERLELLLHPARADAERHPAARQHVDGGELLGRQHRRPVRDRP